MLDRARPELTQTDLLRIGAFEPSLPSEPPRSRFQDRSWIIPLASFAVMELLFTLAPQNMPEVPAPLLVDVLGPIFAYGMLAMAFSMFVPKMWAGFSAAGFGAVGLGLHAWCGFAGHVPMTAGWYVASGALMAAYAVLGLGVGAKALGR